MYQTISIPENKRFVVTRNDRFIRLLTPGVHRIFSAPLLRVQTEAHDLRYPAFRSKWTSFLIAKRPALVSRHFVVAETGPLEVAMISVNGALDQVLWPGKTMLFWKDAGSIKVELVNIGADDDAPADNCSAAEDAHDWAYETPEES